MPHSGFGCHTQPGYVSRHLNFFRHSKFFLLYDLLGSPLDEHLWSGHGPSAVVYHPLRNFFLFMPINLFISFGMVKLINNNFYVLYTHYIVFFISFYKMKIINNYSYTIQQCNAWPIQRQLMGVEKSCSLCWIRNIVQYRQNNKNLHSTEQVT